MSHGWGQAPRAVVCHPGCEHVGPYLIKVLLPLHPTVLAVFSSISGVCVGVHVVFSELYLGIPSKKIPYSYCAAREVPSEPFNL